MWRNEKMKFCITFTICFLTLLSAAFGQGYAVLVQESPAGAGEIQPGIGVHNFSANEIVTLTAIPKTGWKFVYWLGDVYDPTKNRTMTAVDGPKIIIAVFERDEFEFLAPAAGASLGPAGLTHRYVPIGGSLGSGYTPPPSPPPPPPPPPPIPEPQTIALFATGGYLIRRNLSKKRLIDKTERLSA